VISRAIALFPGMKCQDNIVRGLEYFSSTFDKYWTLDALIESTYEPLLLSIFYESHLLQDTNSFALLVDNWSISSIIQPSSLLLKQPHYHMKELVDLAICTWAMNGPSPSHTKDIILSVPSKN